MVIFTIELILGLIGLYFGAEYLVQGSSRVASAFGVKPIIIGLTLVAFGTSAPELFVSFTAALQGHADICIGNVVGSNISNIALILGISSLIKPTSIEKRIIKLDTPLLLAISLFFWVISIDGRIDRLDGIIFIAILTIYLIHAFRSKHGQELNPELLDKTQNKTKNIVIAAFGLITLVIGANLLVTGAVGIARFFAIPELVIGLSIVAVGTSLPEMATSIYASLTDKDDISVGNIVGSNLFNLLFVIGLTSLFTPLAIDKQTIVWDMPIMLALTIVMFISMLLKPVINRIMGFIFLTSYIGYIVKLFFF